MIDLDRNHLKIWDRLEMIWIEITFWRVLGLLWLEEPARPVPEVARTACLAPHTAESAMPEWLVVAFSLLLLCFLLWCFRVCSAVFVLWIFLSALSHQLAHVYSSRRFLEFVSALGSIWDRDQFLGEKFDLAAIHRSPVTCSVLHARKTWICFLTARSYPPFFYLNQEYVTTKKYFRRHAL